MGLARCICKISDPAAVRGYRFPKSLRLFLVTSSSFVWALRRIMFERLIKPVALTQSDTTANMLCVSASFSFPPRRLCSISFRITNATLYLMSKQTCGLSSRAKGLDVPGFKLDNVKMLETPEDARQIHSACLGSNVVLVGTSFVGTMMKIHTYFLHIFTYIF